LGVSPPGPNTGGGGGGGGGGAGYDLEVAKVLFPKLDLFLTALYLATRKIAGQSLEGL
jgi:hypothetical protein